jgi:hypothetical protein
MIVRKTKVPLRLENIYKCGYGTNEERTHKNIKGNI